jgi:hypothetical protein
MASYYKFAERQADSFVNWAEIGKGITDMIQTEVSIREQKKAAIDEATRENLKKVAEAPVGSHEGLNTWTLNYADSAREAILLQDRLLKSGGLKLKDYTVMRQNLNDGTDELFGVIKNFQNTFKEKRDRLISNDPKNKSQQLEMDLMAYTEKFADFSKSAAIIDPRNFTVNVGLMEPDPNNQGVMKVGKQIATTSFLRNIQNTKVDYFDSEAAADQASKNFAPFVRATIERVSGLEGKVVTIDDVRKNPEYQKYLDQSLKSFFSNPFNVTSILTEDLVEDENGNPYVSSISGKQGNVIKYVFDPETNYYKPQLTAQQMAAATDRMKTLIEMRLGSSIKDNPYNRPQPNVGRREDEQTPSGPPINVQETYLSRVKQQTGLSEKTFSTQRLDTKNKLQSILAKIPNGTQLSIELDPNSSGGINLKDGENVIKSFNLYETNPEIRKGYLNEFTQIISNLAGTDGMIDYLGRTGGTQQSGGASQFNPK